MSKPFESEFSKQQAFDYNVLSCVAWLGRRPRGTAFLKFRTATAVDAAVSSANDASGLGIILKGRQLKVLKALDKESARKKGLGKLKDEVQDRRNLYLAKVFLPDF